MRNSSGFTMLEIIVVLILMSIMAAYVAGRSLATADLDLTSQADKIRSQIRYAQAEAMKRSDTVWGFRSTGGADGHYWLFRGTDPDGEKIRIPGAAYAGAETRVSLADLKVSLDAFTLFFNRIGKPYSAYSDYENDGNNTPLAAALTVNVSAGGQSRPITITPETGLVR
jgi:prepilin-type N-terminal cleavage/methylation domain-containing protein